MGNLSFSEPFGQNAHIPRVLRRSCDRRRVVDDRCVIRPAVAPAVRAGLRIGKGHINRLRIRPRSEHTPAHGLDRTGNEDLRDGSATSEGVVLDGRDPCGDSEFRQRGALPEGTLPDAGQALVQRDRGERSATVEGSVTDSLETGRQSYGLQRLAVGKHAGVVPVSYTHLTLPTIYSV